MITDKNAPLHMRIDEIAHECSKELLHSEAHELSLISRKVYELEKAAAKGFELNEIIRLLKLGKEHDSS
jgi:hypothetical protein